MTLPNNALQIGIYDRLSNQLSGVGIYDYVPQQSAFPYVVIGEDNMTQANTKDVPAWDMVCRIHVFTKGAGRKSNKTILSDVYDALHRQEANITLSGFNIVKVECEFEQTFQETDNEGEKDHYYHGVQDYRFLVEQS